MDLIEYTRSPEEQRRIADLLRLLSGTDTGDSVLDIGARDGYISHLLTQLFPKVVALDLVEPMLPPDWGIETVQGDATDLHYPDSHFDTVIAAEVLEHIPGAGLKKACTEIARVARARVLIGVPYKQDIRLGRTRCSACGGRNPPWGHVSTFDEARVTSLFASLNVQEISYVGSTKARTNALSCFLMDAVGNPWGWYHQKEPCVHCGARLQRPPESKILQKLFARIASAIDQIHRPFIRGHAEWVHVLFEKALP